MQKGTGDLIEVVVAGHIDETISRKIKDAVRSLENIQLRDLMALLGQV
jgi:hypothetical protein